MVAGKLAKMPQGARTDLKPSANLRNVDAAQMLNVSTRSVETAKSIQREAGLMAVGGEHGGRQAKDGFRKNPSNAAPTLSEAGIDKNLAFTMAS